ncbi:hypothetical protein ISN36_07810 [Xanthomonas translucens pv. undulosa]|uniref:hypothetical protein n=1 Tax=Xanthomonas campestris pv. translucens TaxID=343 RepID=UPI0019D6AE9F|nr:hypothetical protein [Xanthomonas translucens]QSQ54077.1 hypothetical protein ISN36_07810 [Xanthomonas translucens pv. undulosa]QSQ60302.1 hypothetical protein ISN38_00425 [Xanthomonas translucens pv. undulosa]
MNIEQHVAIQPRIVELQRAALEFAELGESKVSRLILAACFAAQKLKPVKVVAVDPAADASKPAKGNGA